MDKWFDKRSIFDDAFWEIYIQSTLPPLYSTSEIILVCVQKLIETSYFHQMNKRRHCRISHQCAGGSRRRK